MRTAIKSPANDGAGSKKATRRKKPSGAAKTTLDALHYAIGECGAIPPASNHIPVNVKCVKVEQWRTYAYLMGVSTSTEQDAKQKAFKRAADALIADGHARMWAEFVWAAE
jgi:hypothetical protein